MNDDSPSELEVPWHTVAWMKSDRAKISQHVYEFIDRRPDTARAIGEVIGLSLGGHASGAAVMRELEACCLADVERDPQ